MKLLNAHQMKLALQEWIEADSAQKHVLSRFYWDSVNSDVMRIIGHRSRAIKKGIEVREVSPKDIQRLFHRYHNCCAYCGVESDTLTLDHLVPLARGGRQALGNYLPACAKCNNRKGHRYLSQWRKHQWLDKHRVAMRQSHS